MQKKELEPIIKILEAENPAENAKVGFYYMNNGDESYVKGNSAGLQLLAAEFLKASSRIEQIESDEVETLYININKDWIENGISLSFIQPVVDFEPQKFEQTKPGWKHYATSYGCMALIGVIIISAIVGMIVIIKWVF